MMLRNLLSFNYSQIGKVRNLLPAAALIFYAGHSIADIYQPDQYLARDLPEERGVAPEAVEIAYFKRVVSDVYKTKDASLASNPGNLTLGKWKEYNGFNHPELKTLQEFYYNSADLGLARDMTCVRQWKTGGNFSDASLNQLVVQRGDRAIACYVSNRGSFGGDKYSGVLAYIGGRAPFATVAMEYWPNLKGAGNTVRFFVFGEDDTDPDNGKLVYLANNFDASHNFGNATAIKLDGGDGHSQPGICLSCHGGSISNDGVVTGARFLPFDINAMEFPDRWWREFLPDDLSERSEAIGRFDEMNGWIFGADQQAKPSGQPDSTISRFLKDTYGDGALGAVVTNPGGLTFDGDAVPASFVNDQAMYKNVARPFCQSCHIASSELSGSLFRSNQIALNYICDAANSGRVMPHAEVNERNLQRHAGFVRQHILDATGMYCGDLETLVDFYHSATHVQGHNYKEVNVDSTTDTYAGPSDLFDSNQNGIPDFEENISNKTLQIGYQKRSAKVRFEELDFSHNGLNRTGTRLKTFSFKYFIEKPGSEVRLTFHTNRNTSSQQSFTSITPVFTVAKFSVANGTIPADTYAVDVELIKATATSSDIVEMDDIKVNFENDLLSRAQVIDFEAITNLADVGINGVQKLRTTSASYLLASSNACRANRAHLPTSELDSWIVKGADKVREDAGHFSFSTSPYVCPGDLVGFGLQLDGQPGRLSHVSFDWRNNRGDATFYLFVYKSDGGIQFTDLSALANESFDGHLRILVPSDSELGFSYAYRTPRDKQTTSDFDDFGAAIDNIRVVHYD